jgi:hypothetical protein
VGAEDELLFVWNDIMVSKYFEIVISEKQNTVFLFSKFMIVRHKTRFSFMILHKKSGPKAMKTRP